MENPLNNDNASGSAGSPETLNFQVSLATPPDPDPKAPADQDDVNEQKERLEELGNLLVRVDAHVSGNYNKVVDDSDDDTDAPETSDAAEHSVHVDLAYEQKARAEQILGQDIVTNGDLQELETVIAELDSRINEATPMSFDPEADYDNLPR
jgi:hypothetical protein